MTVSLIWCQWEQKLLKWTHLSQCQTLSSPFGGKYDLLSALWGQSTNRWPKRRKLAVISSRKDNIADKSKQRVPKLTKNLETCFCFYKQQSRGHPKRVYYLHLYQGGGHPQRLCENSAPPSLRSGEGSSGGNRGQAGSDRLSPRLGSHLPSGTGMSVLKRRGGEQELLSVPCLVHLSVTISVHHRVK